MTAEEQEDLVQRSRALLRRLAATQPNIAGKAIGNMAERATDYYTIAAVLNVAEGAIAELEPAS